MHGYAIMTDIAAFSGVDMEPGTLYGALSRLERRGWIRPLAAGERRTAGPRTILSLAGGALGTHLDPDYRMQIRLSRDAKIYIAIFAAFIVGVPALVILPMIPRAIRESRWQPSGSDSVEAIAFSPDGRILASVSGRDQVTLWNVTRPDRATRIATLAGPGALSGLTTIFRDVSDAQPILAAGGRIVADGSAAGGEVHLWTLVALN